MNQPVQAALPASYLKIQGDPTHWGLRTVPPQDPGWNDSPVAIDITTPVAGSLILSPARVGSFALFAATGVVPFNGWAHGGPIELVSLFLYIPTTSGLKAVSSGFPIAAQPDLAALRQSIVHAMTTGTTLKVNIDASDGGVVILNGAQLPFAVLADAQRN
jgi:hypothetical protein